MLSIYSVSLTTISIVDDLSTLSKFNESAS